MTPTDDATVALEAVSQDFACGCEVCAHSAAVCPATASAMIMEIVELRRLRAELAEAASLIAVAGPLPHRITVLKREMSESYEKLRAEVEALRSAITAIQLKCEQYWNGRSIPDEEVHAALAWIYRRGERCNPRPYPQPPRHHRRSEDVTDQHPKLERRPTANCCKRAVAAAREERDREWRYQVQMALEHEVSGTPTEVLAQLIDECENDAHEEERALGPCGKHPMACWGGTGAAPACLACTREQRAVEEAVDAQARASEQFWRDEKIPEAEARVRRGIVSYLRSIAGI